MVFDDSKWFDDPEHFVGLKVISNKSVDFDDPKEFNGSQVFHDPKEILIGSRKFDNPKVYGLQSCYEEK